MTVKLSVAYIPNKDALGIQGKMCFGFSFIRYPQLARQAPQPFCEVWRVFNAIGSDAVSDNCVNTQAERGFGGVRISGRETDTDSHIALRFARDDPRRHIGTSFQLFACIEYCRRNGQVGRAYDGFRIFGRTCEKWNTMYMKRTLFCLMAQVIPQLFRGAQGFLRPFCR